MKTELYRELHQTSWIKDFYEPKNKSDKMIPSNRDQTLQREVTKIFISVFSLHSDTN